MAVFPFFRQKINFPRARLSRSSAPVKAATPEGPVTLFRGRIRPEHGVWHRSTDIPRPGWALILFDREAVLRRGGGDWGKQWDSHGYGWVGRLRHILPGKQAIMRRTLKTDILSVFILNVTQGMQNRCATEFKRKIKARW